MSWHQLAGLTQLVMPERWPEVVAGVLVLLPVTAQRTAAVGVDTGLIRQVLIWLQSDANAVQSSR